MNPAIQKDQIWIPDISEIFKLDYSQYSYVQKYCKSNNLEGQEDKIANRLSKLKAISASNIGIIDLSHTLSIEEVTDIFIRINSQGVVLSQADFAMSKISSDSEYGGTEIRKLIDYFCHFIERPVDYETIIRNDLDFAKSEDHNKIKWVVKENEDIYIPEYTDVLRVSFTYKFHRGKIADLVSLLSGRDFETRENIENIANNSFKLLREGVEAFVNETNFKRFLMIISSAGAIDSSLIRSKNALNFAYVLYLILKEQGIEASLIEKLVRKWLVLSILTGRYSSSPESAFDYDIKRFISHDPIEYIKNTEEGELSEAFWSNVLINRLNTSVRSSPYFNVYIMAQIKNRARGFLSEEIDIRSLVEQRGDIHHIFPKKYLQKRGINNRSHYNQIANYVYTQSEINIKIKDKPPCEYMKEMDKQLSGKDHAYGGILSEVDLELNLDENCIPKEFIYMDSKDYFRFLDMRRVLMAQYIRDYYKTLG